MNLTRRIAALEEMCRAEEKAPCFWCHCEGGSQPCTHKSWRPVPHEAALRELADERT
jgi:hypothetical protein